MKRTVLLALTLSMLFCSCSVGGSGKDTTDESSKGGQTTPPVTTDPIDTPYVPDPNNPYAEEFLSPSAEYRWHTLVHSLANSYKTTLGKTFTRLAEKRFSDGEGGIVTNVPFDSGFVDNDEHFENLNAAVDIYLKSGLKVWLYDEQGYPSGSAGGRVTVNNPEYAAQGLTLIKKTGSGKNPVTVNKDERLIRLYTAYAVDASGNVHDVKVTDTSVSFSGVSGDWTLYVYALKEFYEGTHAEYNGYQGKDWLSRSYVNIMDKNAVASFINIAYKPYTEKFNYFDQMVAVFTDEPSLMMSHNGASDPYDQLAWAPGFEDLFEEMHGYSITHKLHFMFGGKTDEARIVRTNYYQTVAKMVSEYFFGQINDFCVEHGSQLSGHMFAEESVNQSALYGDLMLCYRQMGMPGVDILNLKDSAYLNANGCEAMTVKTAASVSRITDKENVTMVELCALDLPNTSTYGEEEQRIIWNTLNMIFFNGANHINSYVDIDAMRYSRVNNNKQHFVDYFARLAYFSRNAEWDGDIALYNPMATFQSYTMASGSDEQYWPNDMHLSNSIAMKLWANQQDFLRIDDVFMSEAQVVDGRLTNGHASFSAVVLPHVEVMPLETLKKLDELKKAGGSVYFVNGVPTLPDSFEDMEEFKALASTFTSTTESAATVDLKENFSYELKINRASSGLYVSRYELGGEDTYWVLNRTPRDRSYKASCEGAKGFDIYDPVTGEISHVAGDSLEISLRENCALLITVKY